MENPLLKSQNQHSEHDVMNMESECAQLMPCDAAPGLEVTQMPPLPEGKKYHVFVSYCNQDAEWVRDAVQVLEKEYGLKCSYHERDFHPGKTTVRNINEHIALAMKTVIVLTPDFLQSEWCSYETEVVMHLSVDEHQDLLIPMLLKTCDIPLLLRPLTYLDARAGGMAWSERVVTAIKCSDVHHPAPLPNSRSAFFFNPHYYNLDKLCELKRKSSGRKTGFVATRLPAELSNRGIGIPSAKHSTACKLLDDKVFSPLQFLGDKMRGIFVLSCVFFLISTVCDIVLRFMPRSNDDVRAVIVILIFSCPYFLSKYWARQGPSTSRLSGLMNTVAGINNIYKEYCILAGITYQEKYYTFHKPKLHLFFYNIDPCKRYIAGLFRSRLLHTALTTPLRISPSGELMIHDVILKRANNRHDTTDCETVNISGKRDMQSMGNKKDLEEGLGSSQETLDSDAELTTKIYEHLALAMLLCVSQPYISTYMNGTLKTSESSRHNRHIPCLCQFLEQRLEKAERKREKYAHFSTSSFSRALKDCRLCDAGKHLVWWFRLFKIKWNLPADDMQCTFVSLLERFLNRGNQHRQNAASDCI